MQVSEAIVILEYFEEKAAKLHGLSLAAQLLSPGAIPIVEFRDDVVFQPDSAPKDEAIDAFVLTLRLFIQNNEPISLHNIAVLYSSLPIDPARRDIFSRSRQAINERLDARSPIVLAPEPLTNRKILDVFIYGGLAHGQDASKRATFNSWREDPLLFAFRKASFAMILTDLLEFIGWLRAFNQETLATLRAP